MWWPWGEKKRRSEGEVPLSADTVRAAVASDCPECAKRKIETDAHLSENRKRINKIIHGIQNASSTEVLEIGNCLNRIVTQTREYIAASKTSLEKTFTEQANSLETFITDSRDAVGVQSKTVENALALSDEVSAAGEAVDKLAREAKLLALNATIEAARLGSSGNAFGIISDEMNHLSDEIAKANRLIEGSIDSIRKSLPSIMKQTTVQIEKIEAFTQTMKEIEKSIGDALSVTGSVGDNQLETILELSNSALSHLQFQDPMAQALDKVKRILEECHQNLNSGMDRPFTEKLFETEENRSKGSENGIKSGGIHKHHDSKKGANEVSKSLETEDPELESGDVMLF